MTSWDKYAGKARDWSEAEYANTRAYLSHRAELVRTLGPPLVPGDVVLDLACGDGGLADYLAEQRYAGDDASELMVEISGSPTPNSFVLLSTGCTWSVESVGLPLRRPSLWTKAF